MLRIMFNLFKYLGIKFKIRKMKPKYKIIF